jgi:hypothetical protein
MCTCASCSYTDKYSGKGFAEWPRGEPAGPRASAAAYAAHVRYSQQWGRAPSGNMHHAPACSQAARSGVPARVGGSTRYIRPEGCFPGAADAKAGLDAYIAAFEHLNGLKRQEPVKAPASPARPSKSAQHFPELDRQPEAITIYDMRKDKAKRTVGRPLMPGRRVVVKLEERQIKAAEKLGCGNVAAGIRKALEAA